MEHYSNLEVRPIESFTGEEYDRQYLKTVGYKGEGLQAVDNESEPLSADQQPLPGTEQTRSKKCGLPIRIFYAVSILVLLLVLGAIAGGITGGISSAHQDHTPSNASDNGSPDANGNLTSSKNTYILATSKLAASNWTDPNGFTHRFVFFQDTFSAIISRRWDSQNQTWTTNNLTYILQQSNTPLNPLTPSTPLASAACNFTNVNTVHLFYLTPESTITGVAVYDLVGQPDEWKLDTLGGAALTTRPGSQLAATWSRSWTPDSLGWWAVAYQRIPDGGINVANASDYMHAPIAVEPENVTQNSSLAIVSDLQGTSLSGLTLMTEYLGAPNFGLAYKATYTSSWRFDGHLLHNTTLPAPSPTLQFAITRLDQANTIVYLALLPNGTVTGEYNRKVFIKIPSVEFRGGPNPSNLNFSTIATSEEGMFYGISDDQILQYSVNDTDPSVFDFLDIVYP
ncbi:hypothetical protein HD806DRAFT_545039 [Xylariaceae sp. AK1471]|nr:hypothetical protein HD806DRAFT_545039 [Xylariaceae sp. AK1471]